MKSSEINQITGARVVGDHELEIQFSDGFLGRLELRPALWGPIFEPLLNPGYFSQFRLEDGAIRWPNDADFCPDVLRYWCEAGGVKSQEETDMHFASNVSNASAT